MMQQLAALLCIQIVQQHIVVENECSSVRVERGALLSNEMYVRGRLTHNAAARWFVVLI